MHHVITYFIKNMNKATLVFLSFLITIKISGQNNENLRKIVIMSGNDTIEIKKFDDKTNLIFNKFFPQYGISQVLAYTYLDNRLISYTWSHSNIGFVENEYVFDNIKKTKNTYSYDYQANIKITNLMSYHSVEDLKGSKEFKKYKSEGSRYLKSTQTLDDTLITKEVEFNVDGSLKNTFYFTYEKGKLTREKQLDKFNNIDNELIYKYDNNGNELQWMKVYGSSDTAIVVTSVYKDNLLVEVIGKEKGKISSKEYHEYSSGKLISKRQHDENGVLMISSEFHYNQKGNIDYIDKVNKYLRQISRAKYYYE